MESLGRNAALRRGGYIDKRCVTYALVLMLLFVTSLPSARSQTTGAAPPPTTRQPPTGSMPTAPFRSSQPATGSSQQATGSSQPATGSSQPAAGSSQPASGSSQPATGSSQPATGSWPAATGTRPAATGTPPPVTGSRSSGTDARSPPAVAMTTPGAVMTTPMATCPVGYWSGDCSRKCDCSGHPCHQSTASCQCPRCFSGDSCNITAGGGNGRKCVQDFFNARTPEALGSLRSEIQRLPRQLAESDIESIMSDYAATSVNRIRSPKYDVIAKPGGGELAQIRCILAESTARATLASKIKSGSIGATIIINDVTNEVVLNKPNLS